MKEEIKINFITYLAEWSWVSSISIVSDYRLDNQGSIPSKGKGFFTLASVSRPVPRPTQTPIQ
jgi:hypothetical protein